MLCTNKQENFKYKKILLHLIENDDDVREKLFELFKSLFKSNQNTINYGNENTDSKYKEIIKGLKTKIDNKDKQIGTLEKQVEIDNNKIASLTSDNEKLQNRVNFLEKNNSIYEDNFQSLYEIYKNYTELGNKIMSSFDAIVNTSSPISFLLSLSNSDNLKLFIEKLQMEWEKYDESDLNVLNQVFNFVFKQFRLINPEYHRIEANIGDEFNIDKHIRTANSLPVGKITKVIIDGYTNKTGTKKVKSYVEVEKE